MKLLEFKKNGKMVLGVKTEKGVLDLREAVRELAPDKIAEIPSSLQETIEGGAARISALNACVVELLSQNAAPYLVDENEIKIGPSVPAPGKIICVGLNYRKHAEETNSPIPKHPILFNKFNNSLTGHLGSVEIPKDTEQMDYEVELAIVIGKTAKEVSKEEALDYVFGYCTANDLSARDLQFRTNQWLLGKSCDGFCPIGPYLVTADEAGNPNLLAIRSYVNGELRQNSNTSDMIFYCDEIVSYVSHYMTLKPGDVILTGTPEGVAMGYPKDQQKYLKPGDVVTVEVEGLGQLTNRMV